MTNTVHMQIKQIFMEATAQIMGAPQAAPTTNFSL
jgi:hypothetical protein